MKKNIVFCLIFLMIFSVISSAYAQSPEKIKAYLKLLDKKLEQAKISGDTDKQKKVQELISVNKIRLEETKPATKGDLSRLRKELKKSMPQAASLDPGASVSGVIFFSWQKGLQNISTPNRFDIGRVYVNLKNKLEKNTKARVTFDVNISRPNNTLDAYLKYAYVDQALNPEFIPDGTSLRIGLLPTYWIGYVDDVLSIRYIAKSLTDNRSVLSSADFGVGGFGTLSFYDWPKINYYTTVVNGAGYKSAETNSGKNIAVRLDSQVCPCLTLALGGQIADVRSSGSGAKLVNVLAVYKTGSLSSLLEFLYGAGSSGFSIGATHDLKYFSMPNIKLLARYDSYDPNRSANNNEINTLIAGVSYDLAENVLIALDYQADAYGTSAFSNAGKTLSSIYVHSQIKY